MLLLMDLPYAQARPQFDAFEKSLQKHRWINGIYVDVSLPAMLGMRLKEVQMETIWKAFNIALDTQMRNPSEVRQELAKLRDPFDDQPIEMCDVEGGVELHLKSGEGKKPVTLVVGLAGK